MLHLFGPCMVICCSGIAFFELVLRFLRSDMQGMVLPFFFVALEKNCAGVVVTRGRPHFSSLSFFPSVYTGGPHVRWAPESTY